MVYNPQIHHRRSIRLKGYDYSQNGFYFITICVENKECLFGEIKINAENEYECILNDIGKMIEKQWLTLENRFPNLKLDSFIVMPNHFHGIIKINNNLNQSNIERVGVPLVGTHLIYQSIGQPQGHAPTHSNKPKFIIGDIVGAFKSLTTNAYIRGVKLKQFSPFNKRLWQRNYYEKILFTEKAYNIVSHYIQNNPLTWDKDSLR